MDTKKKRRLMQIFSQLEKYDIELHTRYSAKEILEAYEDYELKYAKNGALPYGCSDGLLWVAWSSADSELEGDD